MLLLYLFWKKNQIKPHGLEKVWYATVFKKNSFLQVVGSINLWFPKTGEDVQFSFTHEINDRYLGD